MKPKIFIISGSAGAGKDSVIRLIKEKRKDLHWVITTTSKQPREDESQGNPYYFITKEEFLNLVENNGFFEYENVYGDNYYGMTKKEIESACASGKNIIWQIDYRGHRKIRKILADQIVSIFILPPSLEIAEKRIRSRSNIDEEFVRERLELAKKEIAAASEYDYTVVNEENRLEETVKRVEEIIDENLKVNS